MGDQVSVSLQNRLFNHQRSAFNWEFFITKHLEVMAVAKVRSRSSQTASCRTCPKMAVLVAAFLVSVDLSTAVILMSSLIAWPKLSQSCTAAWGYLYLIFFLHAPFTDIRPVIAVCRLTQPLALAPFLLSFLGHLSTFFFFFGTLTWSLCFLPKESN